jgi:hypothetical protein
MATGTDVPVGDASFGRPGLLVVLSAPPAMPCSPDMVLSVLAGSLSAPVVILSVPPVILRDLAVILSALAVILSALAVILSGAKNPAGFFCSLRLASE